MIIGLTGGLACGKTTVTQIFNDLGAGVIDADNISRALTAKDGAALPSLRQTLGSWAFDDDGHFCRTEVRRRVFSDSRIKKALENILHPLINQTIQQQMISKQDEYPYLILSVPLLLETQTLCHLCQRIAVVDCLLEMQQARAQQRGLAVLQINQMIASQMSREQRLAAADDIINNQGNFQDLRQHVNRYHQYYLSLQKGEVYDQPTSHSFQNHKRNVN